MKLAEKLEIDELVAHLEAPENSDLLTNGSFTSKYRHSENKLEISIQMIQGV